MLGYGRDESVPYAWRDVREVFRGWVWLFAECSWGVSWVGVGILWNVRNDFWVLERVGQLYEVHLELA